MKKLTRALLMCTICSMALTGCAKEVPPATGDESVNTTIDSDVELVPEEGAELIYWALREDFAKDAAARFEAEYGVPVTVEVVGFDSIQKLTLEGPSGNAADVVWGMHQYVVDGYNSGIFLPINDQIVDRLEDTVQEAALTAASVNGELYGVPLFMESVALFYNKDIIDTPATTYEEIIELAPSYTNVANNEYYYTTALGGYTFYPYLSAAGFMLHGDDGQDNDNPGCFTAKQK